MRLHCLHKNTGHGQSGLGKAGSRKARHTRSDRWMVVFLLLITGNIITGCSSTPDEEPIKPAEVLYREGIEALREERFKAAVNRFQDVDRKHHFSKWAVRAQINRIYAQYLSQEYADAISAAERFVRLHPRNRYASYAYYMRGLSYYRQISSAVLDQSSTREALTAFQELISRFPNSDYAQEAERMATLCRDRLAEQETIVGRYYLDQEEYVAAVKRFSQLIENPLYSKTPYMEEALFSLVLAFQRLGLVDDARNYAAVLGHNYPDRPFYKHALLLMEEDQKIDRWQLAELRQGVAQETVVGRFFQGLAPSLATEPAGP